MKIKDAAGIPAAGASSAREAPRRDGTSVAGSPDKVSTAGAARLDASVAAARQGAAVDRAARLDAIAAAIRDGTYQPDPGRIARRMTDDAALTRTLRGILGK